MFAMSSTDRAVLRLVADGQVEALLADQNLADGFSADCGFDRVLNIADIDAEAVGGGAVDIQVDVGLAADLKRAQIGHAGNLAHHALHLVGFCFESFQIAAEQLDRQFAFHAADGFFHVVGDGLREIPVHAGKLLQLPCPWRRSVHLSCRGNRCAIPRAAAGRRKILCCRNRWRRCRHRGGPPG